MTTTARMRPLKTRPTYAIHEPAYVPADDNAPPILAPAVEALLRCKDGLEASHVIDDLPAGIATRAAAYLLRRGGLKRPVAHYLLRALAPSLLVLVGASELQQLHRHWSVFCNEFGAGA